jgi:UDP:flavonoid glycosyltransferase YjiC (YdhE family)
MKRFLFTTLMSEDLGLLARTLPVAKELEKRGHKVAFCNSARIPGKVIEEAGVENLPLNHPLMYLGSFGRPRVTEFLRRVRSGQMKKDFGSVGSFLKKFGQALPNNFAPSTSEVWDMDHLYALTLALNEGYSRCTCDAFMKVMTEHAIDVVVDAWNLWAAIAARALGKPLATIIQADMHPASRGFVWWKERTQDTPTPVPVVNKLLEEYGLEPVSTTAEFNAGDLTLVLGIPETDPLPDHADAEYIGAILWQQEEEDLPAWFDSLSEQKPIVWVYSANPQYGPASAWANSDIVLEACIEALRDEDVQIVLTRGHYDLPEELLPLPANFHCASYVPGVSLARRCDLMIHHGGFGSYQTGLYTGTPAVVIPTFSERESNARHLAAVGAGDFVLPAEYTTGDRSILMYEIRARLRRLLKQTRMRDGLVEELRTKVRKVLSDPTYTKNAKEISAKTCSYGGAPEAARLIEGLAV